MYRTATHTMTNGIAARIRPMKDAAVPRNPVKYRTSSANRGTSRTAMTQSATPPRRDRGGAAERGASGAVEMRVGSPDPGRENGEGELMRTA